MANLTNAQYVTSCELSNCGLVLNDGTSFTLLNAGGILLLNDNSCAVESGVSESVLAATGTGTGSFARAQITGAVLDASGVGTGAFVIQNVGAGLLLSATLTATVGFQGEELRPAVVESGVGSIAWEEHQKTVRRRAQWEADNRRMELLQRKKTVLQLDIGWLNSEINIANEQRRPPRMLSRLRSKLGVAMSGLMAIEDELQEIYIRMMQ
jgi:hypothetical protein